MIRSRQQSSAMPHTGISRRRLLGAMSATIAASVGLAGLQGSAEASSKATRIVRAAMKRRGKGYSYLGTGPQKYGCSGLVYVSVLEGTGQNLTVDLVSQWRSGRRVGRKKIAKGDLVFFKGTQGKMKGPTHVGIAISRTKMIHAANQQSGVTVDSISTYKKHFLGVRRV